MKEDQLTKKTISESFYEKNIFWIEKFLFWTIILSPYMIILNDIYRNKLVYDDNFWIKRAKIYFVFLLVMYSLIWTFSQLRIDNLPAINLLSIYVLLYLVMKVQINYGYLIEGENKEHKHTEKEIENIIAIQNIDNNSENKNIRIRNRIVFSIFFVFIYVILFNTMYQSHYLASIICLFLISGYDYYEQKKFKRDKTELFWKKRIAYYFLVLSPLLIVINFLIYSMLIFKY